MATGSRNAKSQSVTARIPHTVLNDMAQNKKDGESTGQFIVTALQEEIKRRQESQPAQAVEKE